MFMEALSVSHLLLISLRTAELHTCKNSKKSAARIAVPFIQGGTSGYQFS